VAALRLSAARQQALGIVFLLLMVTLCRICSGTACRPPTRALAGNDIVNPINTVWTLVAAFLVFGMQAGFTFLEVGFCRSREAVNVLMECVVDTCLCGLLFYAWGFASCSAPARRSSAPSSSSCRRAGDVRHQRRRRSWPFWLFQYAFADTVLDDHVRRDDRPHRIRRRPDLQRRRLRLHLSDLRPLGVGAGRLPRDDGQRGELPPRPRPRVP
jgi:hypothetical protein